MLKWLRNLFVKTVIVEKPVLVECSDGRPRNAKWEDKEYLRQLRDFGRNTVFMTEVPDVLDKIREKADRATTPDMLKGYNDSILIVKELLLSPYLAQKALIAIVEQEELNKEMQSA